MSKYYSRMTNEELWKEWGELNKKAMELKSILKCQSSYYNQLIETQVSMAKIDTEILSRKASE